jgi:transposase-like protein
VTKPRPAEFKWRQFEPQVILMAVGWYLRFSLSYRDVEEGSVATLKEQAQEWLGTALHHLAIWNSPAMKSRRRST